MLDELPGQYIEEVKNPFSSFDPLFKSADITIGNLECLVGTSGKPEDKPFTFRAHPRVIPILKEYFSAVSVANNHSGDYGLEAFSRMLDLFNQTGLRYFGGGKDIRSAHKPILFEVKDKKIAIPGYNEFLPRSFEALDDRPDIAWNEDGYVTHDIRSAKEFDKADIVIVFPLWGWESEKMASSRQKKLAHLMIDSGDDAIVGGHPYVTQNIEIYKGKPILYSLGNFIFNGFEDEESTTGWVSEMTFSVDSKINWVIHVAKLDKDGIPQNLGKLVAE